MSSASKVNTPLIVTAAKVVNPVTPNVVPTVNEVSMVTAPVKFTAPDLGSINLLTQVSSASFAVCK